MPTKRITLIGLAATLHAMRRWLANTRGVPLAYRASRRRSPVVVVRLDQAKP